MVETTRRREIEAAASTLFHERGYSGTSVRDIARALDIQGASLYAHVTSKEEVLWSIVERTATRFEAAADAATEGIDAADRDGPARRAGPRPCRRRDRGRRAGERLRARMALAREQQAVRHLPPARCLRGALPDGHRAGRRDVGLRRGRSPRRRGVHPHRAQRPRRLVPAERPAAARRRRVRLRRPGARRGRRRPTAGQDGRRDDRPARARPDPLAAGAEPAGVQRGPAARRAVRPVRGAHRRRRLRRGDRLDARRVPDRRPALRRDARQLRADGRPPGARVADARADPAPQAGADREGPGRGGPRPAALPDRGGPRQAARGDVRRPARRQDQVPQRLPLPDGRLGRRGDDRLARRRRRDRRPAGAPRLARMRRTRGRCARSAGRNRSTSCTGAMSS